VLGSFLHNGTLALFERDALERTRRIGKTRWVVRKTVGRPAAIAADYVIVNTAIAQLYETGVPAGPADGGVPSSHQRTASSAMGGGTVCPPSNSRKFTS
jgi:hypothetical protein